MILNELIGTVTSGFLRGSVKIGLLSRTRTVSLARTTEPIRFLGDADK